jgi:hypothetical protein
MKRTIRLALIRLVAVFACASLASGCLTLRRGDVQLIKIDSIPPGVVVRIIPDGRTIETPATIALPRTHSQTLTFEEPGYKPELVLLDRRATELWRNLVWIHPIGWIIGIVVDLSNGSAYELQPAEVTATMIPLQPPEGQDVGKGPL